MLEGWQGGSTYSRGVRLTPEMFGDPNATLNALFQVVDANSPPLHFIMGGLVPLVRQYYAARLGTWNQWESISHAAQG